MSYTATGDPPRHRYTVVDYYRMGEVGILAPDARVELIDGEVIDMAPPGSAHAGTVEQLAKVLDRAVGARAMVRTQNPLRLDKHSEPQPDISVVKPRADFYKSRHPRPSDTLLVVEVADSSLRFDRTDKVRLYAEHGIPEMWLIDLKANQLVRYRAPEQGSHTLVDRPNLGTAIELSALPGAHVDLSALFAP